MLTRAQLDRLFGLISLAEAEFSDDVVSEIMTTVSDYMVCDYCPVHGHCECESAMAIYENLPDDVKLCVEILYDYIYEEES